MKGKLISGDQARPTSVQRTSPCSDCPFRRDALPGWLGDSTPEEFLRMTHGESRIDCHTEVGPQCAGAAIYRRNVCKSPRDLTQLVLPANRVLVFGSPREFLDHHTGAPTARLRCKCGGELYVDDAAEKPVRVWRDHAPEEWTVVVTVRACSACEFVEEVIV